MKERRAGPSLLNFLSFPTTASSPPIFNSSRSTALSLLKSPNSTWSASEIGFRTTSVQPPLGGLVQRPVRVRVCEILS